MKINIGPYCNWIGPYQIAEKILFWRDKDEDDSVHDFGTWLSYTFLNDICQWFYRKRNRKIKIHIDEYDTWSMDYTLGLIIVPMLKQLKATKQGSSHVDDSDVPEELRSTSAPPKEYEYDTDENWHKRWEWVLDEMIWAFEQIIDDSNDDAFFDHSKEPIGYDSVGHKAHNERIQRGTIFFGKYYRGLWD
jgi:hypothetical protein